MQNVSLVWCKRIIEVNEFPVEVELSRQQSGNKTKNNTLLYYTLKA